MDFPGLYGQAEWLDERPDSTNCTECGATVEPFKHPTDEKWLPAHELCEACEEQARHRRTEAKTRVEFFQRHWQNSGVSRRKRMLFGAATPSTDDPIESWKALRRDSMDLHPRLQELITIPPDRSEDRPDCAAYIHGPTGSGKTTQGMLAVRRYLVRWVLSADRRFKVSAKYVDTLDLVEQLKGCYGGDKSAEELIQEYLDADFLVVDELGKERATPNTAQTITRLINYRAESLLPTVWISNFGLQRLADESEVYEGRTRWRLFEMCGGSDGDFREIRMNRNLRDPRHRPEGGAA